MGCAFTKSSDNTNDATNGAAAKNTNGVNSLELPQPPPSDPRLPLSTRQKFSISKSWKGIARAMEPTGINMFVKLFEENAELLNLFQKFQDLKTKESQRESMELAQHASLVMSTLDEAINSLDDVDHFIEYLHSVGRMHVKVKGFKREYFWKIEQPFLLAVKETLDERYTDNIETIYKITVKFILETLVEGYDSACNSSEMPNGNPKSVDNNPAASSSNAENNCE